MRLITRIWFVICAKSQRLSRLRRLLRSGVIVVRTDRYVTSGLGTHIEISMQIHHNFG